MRQMIAVLATSILVLGVTGTARAQTDSKKSPSESKSSKTVTGQVKSASPDTVIVTTKDEGRKAERTFVIDSNTKVKKSEKAVKATDLKPGDDVYVRYKEKGGKATAETIGVKGSATEATEKKGEHTEKRPGGCPEGDCPPRKDR
jgi:cytoskeletal protein RodZ